MIGRLFAAAIAAGALVGVLISGMQAITTTPLIHQAESYEAAASGPAGLGLARDDAARAAAFGDARIVLAHAGEDHAAGGTWAPDGGLERTAYTVGANIVVGVGFALLLTAAFALHGRPVDGRRGLLWGLAGFAVVTLGPGLGLPPELPTTMAAELTARQGWWFLAAGGTAVGLWLIVFAPAGALRWPMVAAGVFAIALPHLMGAPHPEHLGGPVPPELAARFTAAAIATSAVFWSLLGWFAGTFYRRFGQEEAASAA